MTYLISNSKLCEKCGSILLPRAIMREKLKWLGHVLLKKDDRLPKIVLVSQPSRAKQKQVIPNRMGGSRKERFKGNFNVLGECKGG